jgi:cyclophilin family peptidyl-prolyl cis-trans isomerase
MRKVNKSLVYLSMFTFLLAGCQQKKESRVSNNDNASLIGQTEGKQEIQQTEREIVEMQTSFGNIYIWLYDETPKHKQNFLKLAKEGFYDGTTFHRIIDNFMIQGGDPNTKDADPNNDGAGGPGYMIDAEINPKLVHTYGAVAAARNNNPQKRSSGSQFYIVENKAGTPHLNGGYTVFGTVISGMDVVEKIAEQPKDGRDRPIEDIKITVKVLKMTDKELQEKYNFVVPKF